MVERVKRVCELLSTCESFDSTSYFFFIRKMGYDNNKISVEIVKCMWNASHLKKEAHANQDKIDIPTLPGFP